VALSYPSQYIPKITSSIFIYIL